MREENKCPVLKTIEIPCEYNEGGKIFLENILFLIQLFLSLMFYH